jgi:prolyl oligopeptidase
MRILSLRLASLLAVSLAAPAIDYPQTRKVDHVDRYHGAEIADPYRWLEDDRAPETEAWVREQNRVTFAHLEKIPFRAQLLKRLEELNNYPKESAPSRRGEYYFFTRNSGLQNQNVWFRKKGLQGEPELVFDPNTLSPDGTVRLSFFVPNRDATFAAMGISAGGSDWQDIRVMDLRTKQLLPDHIRWVKVSGVSWRGDGFYYSRYPEPEKGRELSSRNEFQSVYLHRVGTAQSEDRLVYENKQAPLRFHGLRVTEDEKYAILNISERGRAALGNALYWRVEGNGGGDFRPLFPDIGDTVYAFVDAAGGKFLIRTNRNAPNFQVVLVDPADPREQSWKVIIPEQPEVLQGVSSAGGKLFAQYLKDVATVVRVYSKNGQMENELPLPGLGTASGFGGREEDQEVFYTFTSFLSPGAIYRYDIKARKSSPYWEPKMNFDFSRYETKRVFFTSKDGTRVPMFLTHKKGLKQDGNNPAVLYGYGGFSISLPPNFNPDLLTLLENGVVYAHVILRGGLEYGEKWHMAGMRRNKQNVFDDFIGAAEYLVKEKYSNPSKLACTGRSNGGLLVGAVINQRPDLYRAAVPAVGVMDMLRFQKFTIGWNWVAEYGSSDNAADYEYLRAYSPLHNIKPGVKYPAVLVTTADHDDRVVPAHSFKYIATLQEKAAKDNPALIRVEVNSGHGASSTSKRLAIAADEQAFILHHLGVEVRPQ